CCLSEASWSAEPPSGDLVGRGALDVRRARLPRRAGDGLVAAGGQPRNQTELRTTLSAAIDELPAAYRVVLVLRDLEGRSNAEIADALGLSIALVKTRAHRARCSFANDWMSS